MKRIMLAVFLAASLSSMAQLKEKDFFQEQKLESDAYKANVGNVVFSNENVDPAAPSSKYITTYTLGDPLYIQAFMKNSVANSMMLQLQESGVKPKEIKEHRADFEFHGGVDILMYYDGNLVTKYEKAGDYTTVDLVKALAIKIDINDNTPKEYFGELLYKDILKQNLTPGSHKLRFEFFPKNQDYQSSFKPKAVAAGEITMVVPAKLNVNEENCFPKKWYTNAALEAEVLKAVKATRTSAFKVLLTSSSDMKIIRHEVTGAILRKTFYATVVSKKGADVWYDSFLFDKEYDGSKFMDATISKDGENYLLPKDKKVNADCLKYLK